MAALVAPSDDLIIVWPIKFIGLPESASARTISLRIYSAVDGFIR